VIYKSVQIGLGYIAQKPVREKGFPVTDNGLTLLYTVALMNAMLFSPLLFYVQRFIPIPEIRQEGDEIPDLRGIIQPTL
jgi:hypothetical protein